MINNDLITHIIQKLHLNTEVVDELSTFMDTIHEFIEIDFTAEEYSQLISTREYTAGFKKRLLYKYSKPIQEMEIFIERCMTIGSETIRRSIFDVSKKTSALRRLYQKSTLIAHEIVYLIKGGYPSGAISRWRSLLETSLISMFIAMNNENISERYLDYEIIERHKELDTYLKHSEYLGLEKMPEDTIAKINETYSYIIEKYGADFSKSHGWASPVLRNKKIFLSDFMDFTSSQYFKPYYGFSNNYVHGGPKSLLYNLGYIDGVQGNDTISGPSNIGFTDPAQLTILSYYNSTMALFSSNPIKEELISLLHLYPMITRIGMAFMEAEQQIINSEKETRDSTNQNGA